MTDGTSSQVECPVCGESFDPTAAGGWCTNSDCGEWQYIGDEVPEPTETPSTPDGGTAASDDGNDDADDGTDEEPSLDLDDPADDEGDSGFDLDADGDDASPADADDAEEPADDVEDEPAETAEPADVDESTCPDCGSDVEPDANFCPTCGADLASTADAGLDACPSCGEDVDADDSFCPNCGEDLDAARESAAGTEPAAADAADTAGEAGPDSLVLEARGEEIAVADGDTVGREARRILTDTGGDEDDAVLIHREHVRFVREDGGFFVVDLGDNPTAVNGQRLSKGDREPIEPGDELELSGVVTLSVATP